MYDTILCAHDLSPDSDPALRSALNLASVLGSRLTVLFAVAPAAPVPPGVWFEVGGEGPDFLAERVRVAAEVELARRVYEMQGKRDVQVVIVAENGEPGDVILAVARRISAGLIVLGTHGRKGWQHLMLGSIAERMVRTAPIPVMTVNSARGAAHPIAVMASGAATLA